MFKPSKGVQYYPVIKYVAEICVKNGHDILNVF
jgi:hypothetical protein